jgi:hypothetical protein
VFLYLHIPLKHQKVVFRFGLAYTIPYPLSKFFQLV